jgi:hypothetical protein
MSKFAAFLALLILSFPSWAEEPLKLCTLRGCSSQSYFPIVGLPSPPPAGTYRVEARINGRAVACEIEFTGGATLRPTLCNSTTGAPWVHLSLERQSHYIGIRGSAPRHVDLKLHLNGDLVGSLTVEPGAYRVFEPNGPECEPICLISGPFPLEVNMPGRADG